MKCILCLVVGVLCIPDILVQAYKIKHIRTKRFKRNKLDLYMCSNENEVGEDICTKAASVDLSVLDLNALFGLVKELEASDQPIPEDMKNAIAEKIQKGAPSDLEMRMEILGLNNPLTQAGFALAFVLITLNTVLGTGWAANLFGMNTDSSFIVVDHNQRSLIDTTVSVDDFRFNYEAYQKNRQDINVDMEDIPIEISDERGK